MLRAPRAAAAQRAAAALVPVCLSRGTSRDLQVRCRGLLRWQAFHRKMDATGAGGITRHPKLRIAKFTQHHLEMFDMDADAVTHMRNLQSQASDADATPLSRAGGCLTPDQPATCRPTRAPPRACSSRELEYRAAGEARRRQDEEETPARSQHKEEEIGDAGAKPGLAAGPALKRHCCFSSSISFITHTKPGLVAGPAAVSLPRRRWRQSSPDSPASRALSGLGPQSDVGPVMTAPQGRRPSSRAVCAMRRRRAEAQGRCQVNDSDVD